MKWFVYLFSCYLLLLPWIPGISGDGCCIEEVTINCNSNQQAGGPQEDDHCPPLFACCSCHGVVVSGTCALPANLIPAITNLPFIYTEKLLSDNTWRIWQPPRFAA